MWGMDGYGMIALENFFEIFFEKVLDKGTHPMLSCDRIKGTHPKPTDHDEEDHSMHITFMYQKSQAYTEVECVAKEFKKSIRFMMSNGQYITIKKDDIISIEQSEDDEIQDSIYEVEIVGTNLFVIKDTHTGEYFDGYDFMGSIDWNPSRVSCKWMGYDEAYQTLADLNAME
jgi:hypothetical protein